MSGVGFAVGASVQAFVLAEVLSVSGLTLWSSDAVLFIIPQNGKNVKSIRHNEMYRRLPTSAGNDSGVSRKAGDIPPGLRSLLDIESGTC
jgi:hypothetical protein